jgi:hypothetical protein
MGSGSTNGTPNQGVMAQAVNSDFDEEWMKLRANGLAVA